MLAREDDECWCCTCRSVGRRCDNPLGVQINHPSKSDTRTILRPVRTVIQAIQCLILILTVIVIILAVQRISQIDFHAPYKEVEDANFLRR